MYKKAPMRLVGNHVKRMNNFNLKETGKSSCYFLGSSNENSFTDPCNLGKGEKEEECVNICEEVIKIPF